MPSTRRRDTLQMPSADGGEGDAARPVQVDDPTGGEIALQGARRLLLDLGPRRVGDRGQLAVQIVHDRGFPFSEPMPSEPSGAGEVGCEGSAADAKADGSAEPGVGRHLVQECRRRHKEQVAGDGPAEIENAVVIARRPADKHVLQHLLDGPGRAAVADEVGAELALPNPAKRHVVADDLDLLAVFDDRVQRIVRIGWSDRFVDLDIRQFGAADDALLRLGRQCIPSGQIVQVLLHDDVAAAGKTGVFLADHRGVDRFLARGVLGPVDKPQQVAAVEIAKAVHLVDRGNGLSELRHDLRRQFEAQIHAPSADMKRQVAGCRDRVAGTGADLAERVQLCRPRLSEEPVPRLRPERHDAREVFGGFAKPDRSYQPGEIPAQRSHLRATIERTTIEIGVDRYDQKDRRAGQPRSHRLWDRARTARRSGRGHRIGLHRSDAPR